MNRMEIVANPLDTQRRYNKHLTNLVFSVHTVSYGSSFFPQRFMARALRAWAINRSNRALYTCLQSLILTLGGLGQFSQPSSCLDEAICKHGKSALLLKQNISGSPTNSAKTRLTTCREMEPNFSNIFRNLTISASQAPSVAFERYTMKYPTRHLYFLGIHTSVYTEKNSSLSWDITIP